jgi:hypothetical protein
MAVCRNLNLQSVLERTPINLYSNKKEENKEKNTSLKRKDICP